LARKAFGNDSDVIARTKLLFGVGLSFKETMIENLPVSGICRTPHFHQLPSIQPLCPHKYQIIPFGRAEKGDRFWGLKP
jgi:hypothetical protein